ncbi:MAG: inosine/xanthosine triphosphatase [Patescibacteria group bacterium]|nr:inosine/xanthosine triphosphatase [Patescibacteria group bacterium]
MRTLKIAVGTISKDKIKFLSEVIENVGLKAKIIPCQVQSGVSDQPITETETKEGSINRANRALDIRGNADFGLGIEVGYHLDKSGRYEIFCCASIVDKKNYVGTCESSRFPLPDYHHNILKEGKFLGHHVQSYKKSKKDKVTMYVREFLKSRKHLISEATRNVLLLYLNRQDYKLS